MDLIIVCASVPWNPNYKSRFDLCEGNIDIFKEIIPILAKNNPNCCFIIISNPVDVMTYFAIKFSNLPFKRVMGIGTLIDSARLRSSVSQKYQIHPDDLRVYVLGEHGPTQFAATSSAYVGGTKIIGHEECNDLLKESVESAYKIVHGKGYSNFAISMATSTVVKSIANDLKRTMPISTLLTDGRYVNDVCLSVPAVIGRHGIERLFHPDLNEHEIAMLKQSAQEVKDAIIEYGKAYL